MAVYFKPRDFRNSSGQGFYTVGSVKAVYFLFFVVKVSRDTDKICIILFYIKRYNYYGIGIVLICPADQYVEQVI